VKGCENKAVLGGREHLGVGCGGLYGEVLRGETFDALALPFSHEIERLHGVFQRPQPFVEKRDGPGRLFENHGCVRGDVGLLGSN
jgi:hypothetical protein